MLQQSDADPASKDANVTRQRDLQPGAERETARRGDRRERRVLEPRERLLGAHDAVDHRVLVAGPRIRSACDAVLLAAGEHRGVDAAGKGSAGADDDKRSNVFWTCHQGLAEFPEFTPHLDREAVELVGPVQGEGGDVPLDLDLQRLPVGFHRRRVLTAAAASPR